MSACGGWGEKDVNNLSLIFTGVFAGKMEKMDGLCLSYPQVVHILWIKLRKLPVYLFYMWIIILFQKNAGIA